MKRETCGVETASGRSPHHQSLSPSTMSSMSSASLLRQHLHAAAAFTCLPPSLQQLGMQSMHGAPFGLPLSALPPTAFNTSSTDSALAGFKDNGQFLPLPFWGLSAQLTKLVQDNALAAAAAAKSGWLSGNVPVAPVATDEDEDGNKDEEENNNVNNDSGLDLRVPSKKLKLDCDTRDNKDQNRRPMKAMDDVQHRQYQPTAVANIAPMNNVNRILPSYTLGQHQAVARDSIRPLSLPERPLTLNLELVSSPAAEESRQMNKQYQQQKQDAGKPSVGTKGGKKSKAMRKISFDYTDECSSQLSGSSSAPASDEDTKYQVVTGDVNSAANCVQVCHEELLYVIVSFIAAFCV